MISEKDGLVFFFFFCHRAVKVMPLQHLKIAELPPVAHYVMLISILVSGGYLTYKFMELGNCQIREPD